jgi:hypothetical protein
MFTRYAGFIPVLVMHVTEGSDSRLATKLVFLMFALVFYLGWHFANDD